MSFREGIIREWRAYSIIYGIRILTLWLFATALRTGKIIQMSSLFFKRGENFLQNYTLPTSLIIQSLEEIWKGNVKRRWKTDLSEKDFHLKS